MKDTPPPAPSPSASDTASAPDPRANYASPEDLREDIDIDLAGRAALLRQWQEDLEEELNAEAEGMSVSDPISPEAESRLANELRRVAHLLEEVVDELRRAGD